MCLPLCLAIPSLQRALSACLCRGCLSDLEEEDRPDLPEEEREDPPLLLEDRDERPFVDEEAEEEEEDLELRFLWLRDLLLLLLRLDVSSSPPPPPPRRASRLASSSPPKPVDAAVLRRGARLGASPRPKLDIVCVCVFVRGVGWSAPHNETWWNPPAVGR